MQLGVQVSLGSCHSFLQVGHQVGERVSEVNGYEQSM